MHSLSRGCIFAGMRNAFKKPQLIVGNAQPHHNESRTLHFIDIENLSESTFLSEEVVREAKREYLETINPGEADQFVIGVSHFNLAAATFGWGSGVANYVVRSGQDGADLALLNVMADRQFTDRFQCVSIASGDGIFAGAGQILRSRGHSVTFIAREYCLSQCILQSGCECLILPSLIGVAEEYELVS